MKTKTKVKKMISMTLILAMVMTTMTPVFAETQTQEATASVFSLPTDSSVGQLNATVKGRTVVNLLGYDGDCEDVSSLRMHQSTSALESNNKMFSDNSIKATIGAGFTAGEPNVTILDYLDTTKYYLTSVYVRNGNLSSGIRLRLNCIGDAGYISNNSNHTGTAFVRQGMALKPSDFDDAIGINLGILIQGAAGQYGYVDGIMINEITEDEYNNLTVDQLLEKYPYTNGATSTDNIRIKSIGKNLVKNGNCKEFTANWNASYNNSILSIEDSRFKLTTSSKYQSYYQDISVKPNTWYYLNSNITEGTAELYIEVRTTDITTLLKNDNGAFNTLDNSAVRLRINNANIGFGYIDSIQLEEGTTATIYEPYIESSQYIQLAEDIDGLHSLPNGVYDEINIETGNLMQKTKKIEVSNIDFDQYWTYPTNVDTVIVNHFGNTITDNATFSKESVVVEGMSYINTYYDDVSNIGKYFVDTNNKIYFIVPNGTYASTVEAQANFPNQVVQYQLAEPKIIDLDLPPIIAFENGTVYVEPAVKSIGVTDSDGRIYIENTDLPIDDLESVKKIKGSARRPVDDSDFNIDDNGKYIEIIGAGQGEIYEYIYRYDQSLTTIPTIEYTVPTDLDGQIDSMIDSDNNYSETIDSLLERIDSLEERIKITEGNKVIHYEYDENGSLIEQTSY